ncbi:hypothetical protein HDU83_006550 [Entophlyctis luteolus]|nr:hypothetical protein HDU83_006550 [Entophlyctis luteolus]
MAATGPLPMPMPMPPHRAKSHDDGLLARRGLAADRALPGPGPSPVADASRASALRANSLRHPRPHVRPALPRPPTGAGGYSALSRDQLFNQSAVAASPSLPPAQNLLQNVPTRTCSVSRSASPVRQPSFPAASMPVFQMPDESAPPDTFPRPYGTLISRTTPPPVYDDEPLPTGISVISIIKIDYTKAPNFFDPVRPMALEDKISNIVFATRMATLNQALNTREMKRSMWFARWFPRIALAVAIFFAALAVFVYVITANQFSAAILLYILKCQELAAQWTKEDELQCVNLMYKIQLNVNERRNSSMQVALLILGKTLLLGYGNEEVDLIGYQPDLPLYVENEE